MGRVTLTRAQNASSVFKFQPISGRMCYLTPDNSRRFRWLSVAFESSHSDTHDDVTYCY